MVCQFSRIRLANLLSGERWRGLGPRLYLSCFAATCLSTNTNQRFADTKYHLRMMLETQPRVEADVQIRKPNDGFVPHLVGPDLQREGPLSGLQTAELAPTSRSTSPAAGSHSYEIGSLFHPLSARRGHQRPSAQ